MKERCDLCNRSLRIRIIATKPELIYEVSKHNATSKYGGVFCSSGCSLTYTDRINSMLNSYKKYIKKIRQIQGWWVNILAG